MDTPSSLAAYLTMTLVTLLYDNTQPRKSDLETPMVAPVRLTDSMLPAAIQLLEYILDSLHKYPSTDIPLNGTDSIPPMGEDELKLYSILLKKLKDVLMGEARVNGVQKLNGYSDNLLSKLASMKAENAKNQLELFLKVLSESADIKWAPSIKMVDLVLDELKDRRAELANMLSGIDPLIYS
ncbi:hypothetical protein AAG570_009522 [Ranatra chinensis]|uniref:Uncharacterized protein n=1 Tax=Ranatra chinensis TaxID=642074 RepID=A0ABD0YPW4_9HEMI